MVLLPRSSALHLTQGDTVFCFDLLPETIIPDRLAVVGGLPNQVKVLFAQLGPEQVPVGGVPFGAGAAQSAILGVRGQPTGISPSVDTVAGPAVFLGAGDQAGPDGVEFDVAHAGEEVALRVYEAGAMAPFPQGSGAAVLLVDVLGVAAAHDLQGIGSRGAPVRGDQEVDVVGHEAVGMNGELIFGGQLLPQMEVKLVVLGFEEAGFTVVAALDNVIGHSGQVQAGATRHGKSLCMTERKTGYPMAGDAFSLP